MRKRKEQKATILGSLVFNIFERNEPTGIWCQECGEEVSQVDYSGDSEDGKLRLALTCELCKEEASIQLFEEDMESPNYWMKR